VRSDTARRQAQDNLRRYLEELKILRERDVRQVKEAGAYTRSLLSSTWSALFGMGGAREGCVGRVKGVLGGVKGV
jgi:hypothetical protein